MLAETLSAHAGARFTWNQLDAISEINDTVGSTGDNADEGSESGRVLHVDSMDWKRLRMERLCTEQPECMIWEFQSQEEVAFYKSTRVSVEGQISRS